MCAEGRRQSPINIPLKAIQVSHKSAAGAMCRPAAVDVRGYSPVRPTILNTGVGTMQVRVVNVIGAGRYLHCALANCQQPW